LKNGRKQFFAFAPVKPSSGADARVKGGALAESEASLEAGKHLRSYSKKSELCEHPFSPVRHARVWARALTKGLSLFKN
jgi:hypothetical protein